MSSKAGGRGPIIARVAARACDWSERWVPDAYVAIVLVVAVVAVASLAVGAPPMAVAKTFGDGFWSLIPFTMQMTFIIIGGYIVAESPPVAKATRRLAALPRTGRGAVLLVALFSMGVSLLHWGMSVVLASLLARALARRTDLTMDYRAAAAAAYLGIGSVWALGLSSSAAQLQANPTSMPPAMLAVTGVIPFEQTIFLWQSMLMAAILIALSAWIAWISAPAEADVRTAADLGVEVKVEEEAPPARTRPGEWLEHSPLLSLFLVGLGGVWIVEQVARTGVIATIANLNTYNFIFLMAGLLLHWTPRSFLASAYRSMTSVGGVLIQFPLVGAVSMMMTTAANPQGATLATAMSEVFTRLAEGPAFPVVVGAYSAVLGLLVPSGGAKWVIEAPYVMQSAVDVQYHLGWVVQIYNAAEALPNLINPFWMLPVLGIMGLKARDVIGFTFVQFAVHLPVVLVLVWLLGTTLTYTPPAFP